MPAVGGGVWAAGAAGAAATALAGTALFNHWNSRKAEKRNPAFGDFIDIDGMQLQFVDRGTGSPILLLHGNGGMAGDYQASGVIDRLSKRHRVIAFDRPGFGYSARPRTRLWTPTAQAELASRLMQRLNVRPALVLGHSWGTLPAIALALDHPSQVRGLVLGSGVYYPGVRQDVLMSLPSAIPGPGDLLCHTLTPLVAGLAAPMQSKKMFDPAPVPEHYSDFPMGLSLRPSQMRTQCNETVMLPAVTQSLSKRYGDLTLPVTIIAGSGDKIADPVSQARRLHREIAHSRLIELPGVGHMIHYSALEELLSGVEETDMQSGAES